MSTLGPDLRTLQVTKYKIIVLYKWREIADTNKDAEKEDLRKKSLLHDFQCLLGQ